jgi:hypothetical protein
VLDAEEYWDEMRLVLGSMAEEAADDLVSLSSFSFSSEVRNCDSNSWILALAVLSLSSSSFSRLAELEAIEAVDFSLSTSLTKLSFSDLRLAMVRSVSMPEYSVLRLAL